MEEKKTNSVAASGVSTLGLLGIAFVVLRLCGVITWPWLWVTVPFWGPVAIAVVVAVVTVIITRRKAKRTWL